MLNGPIDLPTNCRAANVTHVQFLKRNTVYAILNASVILERNEMRLARNEKRLERKKTRLARNKRRGGKLTLSGTVCIRLLI